MVLPRGTLRKCRCGEQQGSVGGFPCKIIHFFMLGHEVAVLAGYVAENSVTCVRINVVTVTHTAHQRFLSKWQWEGQCRRYTSEAFIYDDVMGLCSSKHPSTKDMKNTVISTYARTCYVCTRHVHICAFVKPCLELSHLHL